jgi:hypothetical protein
MTARTGQPGFDSAACTAQRGQDDQEMRAKIGQRQHSCGKTAGTGQLGQAAKEDSHDNTGKTGKRGTGHDSKNRKGRQYLENIYWTFPKIFAKILTFLVYLSREYSYSKKKTIFRENIRENKNFQ